MKAKYSIRALLYLARNRSAGKAIVRDIAQKEGIPQKFLEAILLELRNEGILQSKPGKGGGYTLGRPPDTISLGRVVRMIDGPLAPVPCVSQTAYAPCKDCPNEKTCVIRLVMKEVRDTHAKILDEITFANLLQKESDLQSKIIPMDFEI